MLVHRVSRGEGPRRICTLHSFYMKCIIMSCLVGYQTRLRYCIRSWHHDDMTVNGIAKKLEKTVKRNNSKQLSVSPERLSYPILRTPPLPPRLPFKAAKYLLL